MHIHNILTRFVNFYKKRGILNTLFRISEQPYRILFKGHTFLYYAEMNEINDAVLTLPPGISVESKKTFIEAVQPDMQIMVDYWNKEKERVKIIERFKKGAILWIIKLNGNIAGFGWSIKGKMVHPFYFPLTPHDAVLFSYEIFEEYRGRGFYHLLINYILGTLKLAGVSRGFGFVYALNASSINGIEKSYFRKFCKARRFHPFRRNITIWS